MNYTILPEFLENHTIKNMVVGDVGYTVPWAMYAEKDRTLFIHGDYTVHKNMGGTAQMMIKRTQEGVTVYANSIPEGHTYSANGPCYVGGVPNPLPVVLKI